MAGSPRPVRRAGEGQRERRPHRSAITSELHGNPPQRACSPAGVTRQVYASRRTPRRCASRSARANSGSTADHGERRSASSRWTTKMSAAWWPRRRAAMSSPTWRVPRAVGQSGNSARRPSTKTAALTSASSGRPRYRIRKSMRLRPDDHLPLDHFCAFQPADPTPRRCKMYNLTCQGRYQADPEVALAGQSERKRRSPARGRGRGQQQPRSRNQDPFEPPRVTRSDRHPSRADVGPEQESVGARDERGRDEGRKSHVRKRCARVLHSRGVQVEPIE